MEEDLLAILENSEKLLQSASRLIYKKNFSVGFASNIKKYLGMCGELVTRMQLEMEANRSTDQHSYSIAGKYTDGTAAKGKVNRTVSALGTMLKFRKTKSFNEGQQLASMKISSSLSVFDIKRLASLDVFVLDNSLRETTVGQLKGHILSDKIEIFNSIQGLGITDYIVATFSDTKAVDDEIASHISLQEEMNARHFYCFSEFYDTVIDGIPCADIPIGMTKMLKYNIKHIILEVNLCDDVVNYADKAVYSPRQLINECLRSRIQYLHDKGQNDGRLLINLRDIVSGWFITRDGSTFPYRERILSVFKHLSRLPPGERPFGILTEEPGGLLFPWQVAEVCNIVSQYFIKAQWKDFQFLLHCHKGFGMAEANVLAALSNGCTGIWAAVCEEGAICGHASTLMALTNLARLGNPYILQRYNLPQMLKSAIRITEITTGQAPHSKQEIYGARAFDILAQGMKNEVEVDPAVLLHIKQPTRISSIATPDMIRDRLNELFGAHDWSERVLIDMRARMLADLMVGKKYEYQSSIGLLNLYERAGGTEFISTMVGLIAEDSSYEQYDKHHLIIALHERFMLNCDMVCGDGDGGDGGDSVNATGVKDSASPHNSNSPYSPVHSDGTSPDHPDSGNKNAAMPSRHAMMSRWHMDSIGDLSMFSPPLVTAGINSNNSADISSSAAVEVDEYGVPLMTINTTADMVQTNNNNIDSNVIGSDGVTDTLYSPLSSGSNASDRGDRSNNSIVNSGSHPALHMSMSMSYERFHRTFLSNWMPRSDCPRFKEIIAVLDADGSGSLEWGELLLRARWALAEFPVESMQWTLEQFIQAIFETFVYSSLRKPKKTLKIRSKSFALQHTNTIRLHNFHLTNESMYNAMPMHK